MHLGYRRRPYRVEYTGSLLTSEVKRRRARLVLGWGTAREDLRVLSAFCNRRLSASAAREPPSDRGYKQASWPGTKAASRVLGWSPPQALRKQRLMMMKTTTQMMMMDDYEDDEDNNNANSAIVMTRW